MTYGYSIERGEEDPLVNLSNRMNNNLSLAVIPLRWLVDIIPAIQLLPEGFLGMRFKEIARQWKKINQAVADIPYSFVQKQMASGNYQPSYVSNLVHAMSDSDTDGLEPGCDDELAIKWTAASLFGAGADAVASSLTNFVLAMVMFPEVQNKAQKEIDDVIGTDRLPTFGDRERLPYTEGIVKEVFRWNPFAPLGAPHVASEDIIYESYRIPKGAYIFPAAWSMLQDHNIYAQANTFKPERYLEPNNEPDPKSMAFGYGRRICPGRYFADSAIFLSITHILAMFKIAKAVDAQGMEIDAQLQVSPGVSNYPAAFPYKISPRGAKQIELIKNINSELPSESSDAAFMESFLE